jgi:death-on-curing protein
MRYLSLAEVLVLHDRIITHSGGAAGLRDLGSLESALAQPRATFDGVDLYPSLAEKAAALAYSLVGNHPFVDGNKRIGHAALETFLVLNGFELEATVDDAESLFLHSPREPYRARN